MWLRSLEIDRLRNLKTVSLRLPPGLTVLTGRNGQGKTSVLEAAYLLGTAHSFRTRRHDELIGWDGGPLRVSGEVTTLRGEHRLGLVLDQGQRRLTANGAEVDLDRFLGRLDLVALSGETMRTLRDEPASRRRFVDRGVAGLRPAYLQDLAEYRRTLAERNALVRRSGAGSAAGEMDAWEERLAQAAAAVHRQRREYLLALSSRLGPSERALFPDGERLVVRYRPSPAGSTGHPPAEYGPHFRERLGATRRRDAALGFTSEGPHRDELEVRLEEADLRKFGSAGQVRAAMIALSAAQLDLLKEARREAPLFLMDDFDSDLDELRVASLVDFLREGGFQALLATSKDGIMDRLGAPATAIRLERGAARAL